MTDSSMPPPPKTPARTTRSRTTTAPATTSKLSSMMSTPSKAVSTISKAPKTPGTLSRLTTRSKQNLLGTAGKDDPAGKTPRKMPSFALPLTGSSKTKPPKSIPIIGSRDVELIPSIERGNAMQAFLRIRPRPAVQERNLPTSKPYLEMQGDRQVVMTAPADPSRPYATVKLPQVYSFNRVFSPAVPQKEFFEKTTMPLVEDLLMGKGGLLFSYGVSNSGKTYTIQGGAEGSQGGEERGLIPRAIEVVFDSIKGLECSAEVKPVRQSAVELTAQGEEEESLLPGVAESIGGSNITSSDSTNIKVDRNFSYAVFVSYAEVYNEKIFDLLENLPTNKNSDQSAGTRGAKLTQKGVDGRPSSSLPRTYSNAFGIFPSRVSLASAANGGNGILKRQALALKNDPDGGKYVHGLREIRVRTREDAQAVFKLGQMDRQVFGTGLNQQSSRSHGIFTMKVIRVHNGAPNDPESAQVSRLSIVDLAGSERAKNTHNEGDRMKEAFSINKSLMTLGQCMETLRANQALLADKAHAKRKPQMVPFRHSKLTEMFQSFFTGEGRAIMVVHVNPYDTGFDENSHVMRFSAIARDIQTTARNPISRPFDAIKAAVQSRKIKMQVPVLNPDTTSGVHEDISMIEEEFEIVEAEPEDETEEEEDPLVDYLFDQVKQLTLSLMESEMRNATIEAEVREEVVQEMQERLLSMRLSYEDRLQEATAAHEAKTDKKLDILQRALTPHHSRVRPISQERREQMQVFRRSPTPDSENEIDHSLVTSGDQSFDREESPTPANPPTVATMLPATILAVEAFAMEVDDVFNQAAQTHISAEMPSLAGIESTARTEVRPSQESGVGETSCMSVDTDGGKDVLALTSDVEQDWNDSRESEEESEEELESESESEEDSEEEDDDDEQQEDEYVGADEDGSDFSLSEDEPSEEEITPVKKSRRRMTATPAKARARTSTPSKLASPNNFVSNLKSLGPEVVVAPSTPSPRTPLSELHEQESSETQSARSDLSDIIVKATVATDVTATAGPTKPIIPPSTVKKTKRKLGKQKVVLEDDDFSGSPRPSNTEVRRLVTRL